MTITREEKGVEYSKTIPGNAQNFHCPVRFDFNGGYIGISQFDEDAKKGGKYCKERVLLSPRQAKELIEFIQRQS